MTNTLPVKIVNKPGALMKVPQVEPDREPADGVRDIVQAMFRHKRKIAVCFLAATLASLLFALTAPVSYTSQAKLLVRRGRENLSLDPTAMGQVIPLWKPWDNELNSEFEILNSSDLIEKVVDNIGVDAILGRGSSGLARPAEDSRPRALSRKEAKAWREDIEEATRKVDRCLSVEVVKKSDIMAISYTCGDPLLAQRIVSELIHAYIEKHIEVRRARGAHAFFVEQAERSKQELQKTEASLRAAKNEMGIGSLEGRRNINLNRIATLEDRVETVGAKQAATTAKLGALRTMMEKKKPDEGGSRVRVNREDFSDVDSALLSEKVNLASLQAEAKSIMEQMNGTRNMNPSRLQTFQERLAQVDASVASSKAKLLALQQASSLRSSDTNALQNADYAAIRSAMWVEETSLAAYDAEAQALVAQLEEARREVKQLNDCETTIRWLERQRDELETKHRQYVDNLEQARINQALEEEKISNITVVQAATEPLGQNPSHRTLALLIGLFLGSFGGVGLALACARMDNTISRPEEIERKLQLRILGAVPKLGGQEIAPLALKHRPRSGQSAKGVREGWDIPHDARAHFDTLCYRLMLSLQGTRESPIVIGVTSSHGGEGVSSIAANLALSLARHGNANGVLLVDGDFGQSGLTPQHGIMGATGVTEIKLDSKGDIAILDQKLYMLRDDDSPSSVTIPFGEALRLVRLRATDFVILDISPVSEGVHTLQYASQADCVILVVEAEKVSWQKALKARNQLMEAGAHVLGAVLNKRRFHVPGWLYRKM